MTRTGGGLSLSAQTAKPPKHRLGYISHTAPPACSSTALSTALAASTALTFAMVNPRHRGSRGSTPRGRHGSGARGGRGGRGGRGAANAAFLRSTEHFGHRPNGFEQYSGQPGPSSSFAVHS